MSVVELRELGSLESVPSPQSDDPFQSTAASATATNGNSSRIVNDNDAMAASIAGTAASPSSEAVADALTRTMSSLLERRAALESRELDLLLKSVQQTGDAALAATVTQQLEEISQERSRLDVIKAACDRQRMRLLGLVSLPSASSASLRNAPDHDENIFDVEGTSLGLIVFSVLMVVFYYVFADYAAFVSSSQLSYVSSNTDAPYTFYLSICIMILVGFAYLMSCLRRYGYSALGFTLLIMALCMCWATLNIGFWKQLWLQQGQTSGTASSRTFTKIPLDIDAMIQGIFGSASVLIAFGAVIGVMSPLQLIVMCFAQCIGYGINFYIYYYQLMAHDSGGSATIHTFGAAFGLTISLLTWKGVKPDTSTRYNGDMFGMLGTMFLWVFWPSFNAYPSSFQQRAIINTVLSLFGSTSGSFAGSKMMMKNRFNMLAVINSTVSGGVVMGVCCEYVIDPGSALLIGFLTGLISVAGYAYLTPFLERKIGLHDCLGITNLHFIPGVLGCLAGVVATGAGTNSGSGSTAYPPSDYSLLFPRGSSQPGYQFAGLATSIAMGMICGAVTSLVMRFCLPKSQQTMPEERFLDTAHWEVPSGSVDAEFEMMELAPLLVQNAKQFKVR